MSADTLPVTNTIPETRQREQFYMSDYCFRHIRTIPGRPPERIETEKTKLCIVDVEVKVKDPVYQLKNGKKRRTGWTNHRTEKRKYLECPTCFMSVQLKTK